MSARAKPESPDVAALLAELRAMGSAANRAGMARYGINVENAYGVSIYELRKVAKRFGTNHALALALWRTGNHEARLLACFVDDPALVTVQQMDTWAAEFDSWDVCDQACTSLFDRTKHAFRRAIAWSKHERAWIKRGGYALMAGLAWHDKSTPDEAFAKWLPHLERGAFDERNFVKKAVNWALRNLGKRNRTCKRGGDPAARAARWVANDALRELSSDKVMRRLSRDR